MTGYIDYDFLGSHPIIIDRRFIKAISLSLLPQFAPCAFQKVDSEMT